MGGRHSVLAVFNWKYVETTLVDLAAVQAKGAVKKLCDKLGLVRDLQILNGQCLIGTNLPKPYEWQVGIIY